METTRDVRGLGAFIPPASHAAREPSWPPASRAIAIEWARKMRLRERGLAVDDATLERVADAIMDSPYESFYTAVESEDELPGGLEDAVRAYLGRHPEIDGGVDFGWRDGRVALFVGIVGDEQAHRAPLTRIGGDRVVVELRTRTVTELQAIADRILAATPELAKAGLRFPVAGLLDPDDADDDDLVGANSDDHTWEGPVLPALAAGGALVGHGVVWVVVVGGVDEHAADAFFSARYGEAVAVLWLGPSRFWELPHPFGSWTSDGRRLRVFFALDVNGQRPGKARVAQETDEQVVIALSCLEPVGAKTLIGGVQRLQADVELRAPVGDRAVIDASAGVVRPCLADLPA